MKPYFLFALLLLLIFSGSCRDSITTEPAPPDQEIIQVIQSGEFISPAAGDVWLRGSTYRIEWRDFSPDYNIDLTLLKKKLYYPVVILKNSSNLGSYTWKVPEDLHTSTYYQMKLVNSKSPDSFIYSEPFVIR